MNQFNFTRQRIISLKNDTGKDQDYRDAGQKGLVLRVTARGNKIFRLEAWSKRQQKTIKMVIGKFPDISLNDARAKAAEDMVDLTKGIDLLEREKQKREEQSLDDVFNVWLEEYARSNLKRWDQEKRRYELYIQPYLGQKQLSEITADVITRWKIKLAKKKKERGNGDLLSKGLIHRAFIVLSSIFGKVVPHMKNPCSEVQKYKATTRTTFLRTSELQLFFEALDHPSTPDYLKDYLLISLYTGARKSNVLAMRWHHVDLNLRLWMLPGEEMKNTESMIIPLLDQAAEILQRRKKEATSVFVFPTPRQSKTGHFAEPKKAWKSLLGRAGLPETYRLHDLRRTMGSWQAITGASTKIIGASLGHKSEQATKHYAHLTIEPVRAAMQRAADAMDDQQKIKKIVKIGRKS
jgi:integrase